MSSFAFGSYVPAKSPIHNLNAQVKVILACVFSVCILFIDTWAGLACITGLSIAAYAIAHIPLGHCMRGLAPVAFVLFFTVLAHACSFSLGSQLAAAPQLVVAGPFGFTLDGLCAGLFIALRIALLVNACMLLTFTTSERELVNALAHALSPLRVLRVPADNIALVVSLALRFIPLVATEAYAVRDAQRARGADFDAGSPLTRARAWVPIFVPLFARLFKRVSELGLALDARCFGAGARTTLAADAWRPRDAVVLVCGSAAAIALACLL